MCLVLWVTFAAGGGIFSGGRDEVRRAAVGGWLTLGAYLLILTALSVAPLSGVAPLRESATVLAAAWGSVRLGEASDRSEAVRRVGCLGAHRRRGAAARRWELTVRSPRSAARGRTTAGGRTGC